MVYDCLVVDVCSEPADHMIAAEVLTSLVFLTRQSRYHYFSSPTGNISVYDDRKQTDDCFVVHPRSPSIAIQTIAVRYSQVK